MYSGTHCTNGTDKIAKIDFFIVVDAFDECIKLRPFVYKTKIY